MEFRFLEVAQQEFDEAVEYYNAESLGLGDQFLLEALDWLEMVRQFPQAWRFIRKTAGGVRRDGFRTASFTKSLNPKYSS